MINYAQKIREYREKEYEEHKQQRLENVLKKKRPFRVSFMYYFMCYYWLFCFG